MQHRPSQFGIKFNGVIGLIMMVLVLILLFYIAKGIFTLLYWATPLLLIGAVLINYRTITGFLKYLWNFIRRSPLAGILVTILAVVAFPVTSGFLFVKAILDRKIRRLHQEVRRRTEGELIEYEEIHETETEFMDLDTLPPPDVKKSPYNDFFDEDVTSHT